MTNKTAWTEADTRRLVGWIEGCSNPVEAACAVAGATVAVLVHHGEGKLAKALTLAMLASVTEPDDDGGHP